MIRYVHRRLRRHQGLDHVRPEPLSTSPSPAPVGADVGRGRTAALDSWTVTTEHVYPNAAPSFLGIPLTFRDLPAGVQAVMLDASGRVVAECRAGVWTTTPKEAPDAK